MFPWYHSHLLAAAMYVSVFTCVFELQLSFTSGFASFHNVSGWERLGARTPGEGIQQ